MNPSAVVKVGDLVTVNGNESGRVTAKAGNRVEVELDGRRFWYPAEWVCAGSAPPRPVMMAQRWEGGPAVETRPVCAHVNLAELCEECRKVRG